MHRNRNRWAETETYIFSEHLNRDLILAQLKVLPIIMMINPVFGPSSYHRVWRKFGLMQCGWNWCTWYFTWGNREWTSLYQLPEEQELLLRQIFWVRLEMLRTRIKVTCLNYLQATKIPPFLVSPGLPLKMCKVLSEVILWFFCISPFIFIYIWGTDRMKTYRYSQTSIPPVRSHTLSGTHVNHPQNKSTENKTSLVLLLKELLIFLLNF